MSEQQTGSKGERLDILPACLFARLVLHPSQDQVQD